MQGDERGEHEEGQQAGVTALSAMLRTLGRDQLLEILDRVIDLIPGPVALVKRDGPIVFTDRAGCDLWGYSEAERCGLNHLDLVASEDRQRTASVMTTARDKPSTPIVVRFLTKTGERIPHLFSGTVVEIDDEPHFLSMGLDVSEMLRTQEALQRRLSFEIMVTALASRLINLTTEEIPAGLRDALAAVGEFTEVDRALVMTFSSVPTEARVMVEWCRGSLFSVSDRFADMSSAATEPWVSSLRRQAGAYLASGDGVGVPQHLSDLRRRVGVESFLQVPLRCGSRLLGVMILGTVEREVTWTEDTAGLVQLCSEMFANSLDRMEKGRALQMRTAEMRAVLDGTEDGLLVSDGDGRVVLSSRRFCEIWSMKAHPERGTMVSKVVQEIRAQLRDPERLTLEDGVSLGRRNVPLAVRDGRRIEWSTYDLQLPDAGAGVVWSFRDVTDRAELEDQLRQAQKLEAVGQLAGGIAHDFNNVLFTISSASELALLRGTDATTAESLKQILTGAQRAAGLTRQLLAFSRKQVLKVQVIDLNEVVSDMHNMLVRLLDGRAELRLDLAPEALTVRADQSQLEQVVLNLVVNARDATVDGGPVTLRTRQITLSVAEAEPFPDLAPGPHAVLTVTDEGSGMAEDVRSRVFEPFFTTKEVGKGTGLGLATVFGIVKQHRGAIQVDSRSGVGSEFRVYLPHAEPSMQQDKDLGGSGLPRGRGETILLVEDEELARRLTADVLSRLGYNVVSARDGRQALDEDIEKIDLLLTDFVLPHVNGAELVRRLRDRRPGLRVIFMSGHSVDALLGAREVSSPAFLQKPFELLDLARTVRRVLDGSR